MLHETELANIRCLLDDKPKHIESAVSEIRQAHRQLQLSLSLYEHASDKAPEPHTRAVRSALARYQALVRAVGAE